MKRSCHNQQQLVNGLPETIHGFNKDIPLKRITRMIAKEKLAHKNGVVTWWIGNYTTDLDKYEQIVTFKDLFRFFEFENYPLRYESVKQKDEADIKIYYVSKDNRVYSDDEIFECPIKMDAETLAVAYSPYGGEWQGFVFINDDLFWTSKKTEKGKHQLFETLQHELGHTFNLDHSTNPKCIMYYMEENGQSWSKETSKLMFDIYKEYRVEQLRKTYSGILLMEYAMNNMVSKREVNNGLAKYVIALLIVLIACYLMAKC